jgi:hypothetical protein
MYACVEGQITPLIAVALIKRKRPKLGTYVGE